MQPIPGYLFPGILKFKCFIYFQTTSLQKSVKIHLPSGDMADNTSFFIYKMNFSCSWSSFFIYILKRQQRHSFSVRWFFQRFPEIYHTPSVPALFPENPTVSMKGEHPATQVAVLLYFDSFFILLSHFQRLLSLFHLLPYCFLTIRTRAFLWIPNNRHGTKDGTTICVNAWRRRGHCHYRLTDAKHTGFIWKAEEHGSQHPISALQAGLLSLLCSDAWKKAT